MITEIDIRAVSNVHSSWVELHGRITPDGDRSKTLLITGFETGEYEEGTFSTPFARIGRDAAQELANSLWSAGIRPEQSLSSVGVDRAMESHLTDLRAISFKLLKIEDKP